MSQAGSWIREAYQRHRLVLDALGVVLFSVLIAALGVGGSWRFMPLAIEGLSSWATLLTVLPAAVFMLTKRRAPLFSLIGASVVFTVDLLTVGGIGPLLVLLDVLWFMAFQASPAVRRRLLWAIVIAVIVIFAGALLMARMPFPVALLTAAQFGAIFGTDYWWAVAMAQANELAELHRQRADAAAEAAERDREEAIREERETMAKELHDVVAGHVLAMAIRAEAALSTAPAQERDRAALQAVRDAGLDAHRALRSMITVLRHGEGDPLSTPRLADLDAIIDDARRSGLQVTAVLEAVTPLSSAAEQTVVRTIREALVNCARHASGAEVDVLLATEDEAVRVRVISRGGTSFTVPGYSGSGWGLSMLKERVGMLGGTLHAGPIARGWSVDAVLPREVAA
ncbi:signal transduction histidine kinase [Microbacterium keratanolyticum]|uniref:histidine kinase n=3 Tax=Microbacterium keratanolyticum TaxID=67574 RepID=A0A9W6HR31_9MICO|nr:histidine kinase [Microbacterium keratanolyticum]MBM7468766.1 signal transduction histidine kinase [Microbacterium keratanolyticum]GLK00842.1 two-component sensor histidine kinase [Microbacterium keratanolyticum]